MDDKNKDLCKKCEHFWLDFPLPLESFEPRCTELDKRDPLKPLDEVVPYPCLKCPFNSFLPKGQDENTL